MRIIQMVILTCLSSFVTASRRRPTAFAALTHHAGRYTTGLSAMASYSATTMARTKGKDRQEEMANMAERMKMEEFQLREMLTQKLSNMNPQTEKAEYIDWLLSSSDARNAKSASKNTVQKNESPKKKSSSAKSSSKQIFATDVQFTDLTDLHPLSKRAISEVMGLSSMTEIQAKTFEAASSGRDVLGRARTGTGKTLAFLLPAVERVLRSEHYQVGKNIGILVVSPTRELATQIADQAEKLLTFHKNMSVQVMFGGTSVERDVKQLKRKLPTILVATPGRLLDHMQSTKIGSSQFGRDIMTQTPVVVLDETDRLLDMGFRREITKILTFLPKGERRQTLLFSATIPPDCKSSKCSSEYVHHCPCFSYVLTDFTSLPPQ